jgi:hypothetical protein
MDEKFGRNIIEEAWFNSYRGKSGEITLRTEKFVSFKQPAVVL